MMTIIMYDSGKKPQWCPGCGNYGILQAVKMAMDNLKLKRENTVVASGIGCSSKIPHYLSTYGFEGIHGRPLPLASAIKIANRNLEVFAMGGDGDGYGEGVQHFTHACRRNYNITYIVHNNEIYGLTTGQASPTTMQGVKTKSTPFGVLETPYNPLANALINGATYIARGFAGDLPHLSKLIEGAVKHKGFALIDVFQPCVSFNKINTYQWFRERVYRLEDTDYKPDDKDKAFDKMYEDVNTGYRKVPIGLFYKEDRPQYENELPQLNDGELVDKPLKIKKETMMELINEFR